MQMNRRKFWEIRNEANSAAAEIFLYGEIDSAGDWIHEYAPDDPTQSAVSFRKELQALNGKDVLLRINSPGGDVFQAQAMYNILKAYPGKVSCHIDGICASAATLVACAAERIIMPCNALFMIHNPAAAYSGMLNLGNLEKFRSLLDKVKETIMNVYQARCPQLTAGDIERMMDDETWMTADEALEKGFVDEIDEYGVETDICDDGLVIVNHRAVWGLRPEKRVDLQNRFASRKKKGVKNMSEKETSFMEQLKAFFAARDAEAMKVNAETNRIKSLDELKCDNTVVNALVEKAKEIGTTAKELEPFIDAVSGLKMEDKGMEELKALITDQMNSGANGVKAGVDSKVKDVFHEAKTEIDTIVDLINKKRG